MARLDAALAPTQHLPYLRGMAEFGFVRIVRAAIRPTHSPMPYLRLALDGQQMFPLLLRTPSFK